MRSTPGKLVPRPTGLRSEVVAVEVLEPEDSTPRLALPAPSASASYRIPRLPPAPEPIKPTIRRLSAKKAAVLADRVAKRERKANRKVVPRSRRFCKLCNVYSNSAKSFFDHTHSRKHRIQVENRLNTPRCEPCDRIFECHGQLRTHLNSAKHLSVVGHRNSYNHLQ